jgi:peptidyl-prolyl cis-trans isomerase SurA
LKNHRIIFCLALAFSLIAGIKAYPQKEGDRIIAVVGNDIILESDLQYQVQMYARQNQMTSISSVIAQQIFQQMLTDKIIVAKAEQDSITVKDEEVNRELDYRIKSLIDQVGSEKRIEEVYGMPLVKIRLTLREDLEKKIKADKLKRKKFANAPKVSDKEVQDFFRSLKDSLPPASEEYELFHIYINRKLTDAEKQIAREKSLKILDSIKAGVDFGELAKRNSDDKGSAVNGGDLGFAKKGVYVKEFEEALLSLNINDLTEPVETEFGYHIIRLTEKKGDQYRAQHILVSFPMLESSDLETISYLNKLRDSITAGTLSFEDAAKKYSQDKESALKGGYIGFTPVEKFDSTYTEELKKLEIGVVSKPLRIGNDKNYGYELVKLKSKVPAHALTLETDYDKIKKYATVYRENKLYEEWINELKKTVFVDVKF